MFFHDLIIIIIIIIVLVYIESRSNTRGSI